MQDSFEILIIKGKLEFTREISFISRFYMVGLSWNIWIIPFIYENLWLCTNESNAFKKNNYKFYLNFSFGVTKLWYSFDVALKTPDRNNYLYLAVKYIHSWFVYNVANHALWAMNMQIYFSVNKFHMRSTFQAEWDHPNLYISLIKSKFFSMMKNNDQSKF